MNSGSIAKNDYQSMGSGIIEEFAQLKMQNPEMSDDEIMSILTGGEGGMQAKAPADPKGPPMSPDSTAQNPPARSDRSMVDVAAQPLPDSEVRYMNTDTSRSGSLAAMTMPEGGGGDAYYMERAMKGQGMAQDRGTNTGAELGANMGMGADTFSPELMAIYDTLSPELKAELAEKLSGDFMGNSATSDAIAQPYK